MNKTKNHLWKIHFGTTVSKHINTEIVVGALGKQETFQFKVALNPSAFHYLG